MSLTRPVAPPARNPLDKDSFLRSKEISFGSAMGVCSGYLFKKLGKMFVLVAGLGYVTLQMLANAGYIQVNWMLIESRFNDKLDLDRDGKVTVKDAKYGLNWITDLLTRNVQFKSTFVGGFYLGFRYG
ncbi:MAG: FUN14 family-domain-containing protein [Benniella sp.]|nr:MAG: FUN14 family-domain-containing protein [Benniella sp.]